ncbi:uncharacterized protein LOC129202037 [Grus americana]|uniref:uncharacterized protein LOC129202037 n=1 Tax=Grus americana TaxID=9117 RepID=UPI0024081216|nr:uncharacterized protein LOC129202037 [Grus americana]
MGADLEPAARTTPFPAAAASVAAAPSPGRGFPAAMAQPVLCLSRTDQIHDSCLLEANGSSTSKGWRMTMKIGSSHILFLFQKLGDNRNYGTNKHARYHLAAWTVPDKIHGPICTTLLSLLEDKQGPTLALTHQQKCLSPLQVMSYRRTLFPSWMLFSYRVTRDCLTWNCQLMFGMNSALWAAGCGPQVPVVTIGEKKFLLPTSVCQALQGLKINSCWEE